MHRLLKKWSEGALAALCILTILFAAVYTRQEDLRSLAARTADASRDQTLADLPTEAPSQHAVPGAVIRPYRGAVRSDAGLWQLQPGVRYAVDDGQRVCAVRAGTVIRASEGCICLDHGDGLETRYELLASLRVAAGDAVAAGQALGTAGSDGYIEIRAIQNGVYIDPETLYAP